MDNGIFTCDCIKINVKIISIEELLYFFKKKRYIIYWDIKFSINQMDINYLETFIFKFNLKI